jgi:TPR repeat protein
LARFNLGFRYATGRGVSQDDAEAVRWYRLAANGCVPLEAFDVWLSFAWL